MLKRFVVAAALPIFLIVGSGRGLEAVRAGAPGHTENERRDDDLPAAVRLVHEAYRNLPKEERALFVSMLDRTPPMPKSIALLEALCKKYSDKNNSCPDVPDQSGKTGKETNDFQCNRQCRNVYGVSRGIVGTKADRIKNTDAACDCTMDGVDLGQAIYETTNTPFTGPPPLNTTFPNAEPFDNDYWCDAYSTPYVCAINMAESGSKPRTFVGSTSGGATRVPDGWTLLHCGACGACSMPSDIKIIYDTRDVITDDMTQCSTEFALSNDIPFGDPQTRGDLEECLIGKGIAFSTDGRASEVCGQPTCMDCWVDNILNDKVLCSKYCLNKFSNSSNAGDFVNDQCLQCDEYTSGPAFIRCAGANRRSTGIVSDIDRTQLVGTKWDQQTCPVGICSSEEGTESPCETLPLIDP
jgi:hypothetical protein